MALLQDEEFIGQANSFDTVEKIVEEQLELREPRLRRNIQINFSQADNVD